VFVEVVLRLVVRAERLGEPDDWRDVRRDDFAMRIFEQLLPFPDFAARVLEQLFVGGSADLSFGFFLPPATSSLFGVDNFKRFRGIASESDVQLLAVESSERRDDDDAFRRLMFDADLPRDTLASDSLPVSHTDETLRLEGSAPVFELPSGFFACAL